MTQQMQKYLAEVLGTFTLVFGGSLAILSRRRWRSCSRDPAKTLLVVVGLNFGLALLAGLYAFGEVSGGHFNPAVSLALFLDRRLGSGDLIGYWVSQLIGGVLALVVLVAFTRTRSATRRPFPARPGPAPPSCWSSC